MNRPLFIETLRLHNGQWSNLRFHHQRLNHTRKTHFGKQPFWDLGQLIVVPETAKGGLYKCRVTYSEVIEKIEFESYEPRVVQSLCLITDNTIQYDFKYHNRQQLNALFSQRGEADDVLIVQNDLITDTSYANIAFWEGSQWHTPGSYLLAGTQRARLLEEKKIVEKTIRVQDLPKYAHARMINSMLDFETTPTISMKNIR